MPGVFGGGGGGGGGGVPTIISTPTAPTAPAKPSAADLASMGAMKPELLGAATPAWRSGLTGTGGGTGPILGAGGALSTPIGSAGTEVGSGADEMLRVLNSLGQGGG